LTSYHGLFRKVRVSSSSSFLTGNPYIAVIFTAPGTLSHYDITSPQRRFPSAPLSLSRSAGFASSFSLLKRFSAELARESDAFLTLLIKLVSGGAEGGEAWQGWMRALAVEVMQGSVYLLSLSLIVWRL